MPSFIVEFETPHGPGRRQFTLDDDRPLGNQLPQLLEELRQSGNILRGGILDELAVYWDGRELSQAGQLSELGITTARPLQLRMRPVVRTEALVLAPLRVAKGAVAAALQGATGGLCAWLALAWWSDLRAPLSTATTLDAGAGAVFGGLVGALVLGGAARREDGRFLPSGLLGLALGSISGAAAVEGVNQAGRTWLVASPVLVGIVAWLVMSVLTGSLLGLMGWQTDRRRTLDGAVWGLLAGAAGAGLLALPGQVEFWHCAAFVAGGALIGWGAVGAAVQRAPVLLEADQRDSARASLLGLREIPVPRGSMVGIGAARVEARLGGARLAPVTDGGSGDMRLDGTAVTAPVALAHGALIEVAHLRFRALVRA